MRLQQDGTMLATLIALVTLLPLSDAFVSYQSDASTARRFLVNQVQTPEYPYTVHLPDRTTRGLAPLTTPPPLLFSLSGSGARGPANESALLSGYDGASRKIQQYNSGARTSAHLLAAEEFLTVTPVCPADTPQWEANWNASALPRIIAEVAETYEVDLNRVYLSTYSMGTRAAWGLLMANPGIFAGAILSSGATYATQDSLADIVGIPIRNFYGSEDEDGLEATTNTTMTRYNAAYAAAVSSGRISANAGRLETLVVPGANHLAMTNGPWDSTTMVDGHAGALAWLITQTRNQTAQIPGLDLTEYTQTSVSAAPSSSQTAATGIGAAAGTSSKDSSIAATSGSTKSQTIQQVLYLFLSLVALLQLA